jgi:hypothetical protein
MISPILGCSFTLVQNLSANAPPGDMNDRRARVLRDLKVILLCIPPALPGPHYLVARARDAFFLPHRN